MKKETRSSPAAAEGTGFAWTGANVEEASSNRFEQIKTLQRRTANFADYAALMIDSPDRYRKETSAQCCKTNFDELQKIVNDTDDEFNRAKRAYHASKQLRNR